MAEVPEKSLERYDVLDRIAVGGMAEVFLAKAYGAHGFEKTLAIKRILPELARDPEFEDRFIAEAKVAVRLSHTNVVQVFDFGRFAGSLFIAMEYVDGLDLAALLRRFKERGEKVPLPAAFQIAIELARGLDFAHLHGVVHRDVSPSNILLSKAGEVKIADFGIAVAANPGRTSSGHRRKVMGKWRYMSPEQARGEPLDTRSDMFSAASVMYELFTNQKLFPGDEAEDIIRNIHEMELPRASEVRRGLPAKLDDILHHALARKPGDRPARPAVLVRALTELTYESSIITTGLDVAEAVAYVVDLSTPTGKRLDDIIRAQLARVADASEVRRTALGDRGTERRTAPSSLPELDPERQTAVTSVQRRKRTTGAEDAIDEIVVASAPRPAPVAASSPPSAPPPRPRPPSHGDEPDDVDQSRPVLLQTIDSDGITRLELDATTVVIAPWELGQPPPIPASDEPSGTGGGKDGGAKDGGASAAARSPSSASSTALMSQADSAPAPRRRRVALAIGLTLAAAAAATAVVVLSNSGGSSSSHPTTGVVALDAPVVHPTAPTVLQIETVPPGAHGTAGGIEFGPTPVTLQVPPGRVPIRIELEGHQPYVDDNVALTPGQTLLWRATLIPALSRLAVVTDPPGAEATLDGKSLGVTPLTATDLAPRKAARLLLTRTGYQPMAVAVDLAPGATARVERTLRAAPTPMGTIALHVEDGWGDVYLGSRKIGRVPARALRLPVGHHRLRVVNPPTGRSVTVEVDVTASETRYYSVRLE